MRLPRTLLFSVLVFSTGFAGGSVLMCTAERCWLHKATHAVATQWRSPDTQDFVRDLRLSPEQARELDGVLAETTHEYADLHVFAHQIRENGLTQIRAMLSPEQRIKLDRLLQEGGKSQ